MPLTGPVRGEYISVAISLGYSDGQSAIKPILAGSIDLVITRKDAAFYYAPQVPHPATNSPDPLVEQLYLWGPSGRAHPPENYRVRNEDQIMFPPTISVSIEGGELFGDVLSQRGAGAYGGPATYYGGSLPIPGTPISVTGDYFASNDSRSGEINNVITGVGGGAAVGWPPIEGHKVVKNSQMIGKPFSSNWYFSMRPNSVISRE
jgi:hypothetical protein